MEVIGRRCAIGCATWPDELKYAICPRCGEPTSRFRGMKPMSAPEARKMALREAFEHYYENEHVVDDSPLTPEELAKCGL